MTEFWILIIFLGILFALLSLSLLAAWIEHNGEMKI